MKPHCARCQEIIDQVAECSEHLNEDDETALLAALLGLAMIVSPDYEPVGDGKWTKTKSEE